MADIATREEMKTEALERMKKLDIYAPYIKGFKDKDRICFYENFGGYWLDQEPKWAELAKKVEEKMDGLVYAVTHEFTDFGECLSFLFVSKYKGDWRHEVSQNGRTFYMFAWVENLDDEWCSESGTIGVQSFGGGLRRVA